MSGMRAGLAPAVLSLALAAEGGAAEVVILKSSEQPGVRAVVDTLRRVGAAHTFSEFDLGGNRTQGERIAAGFRGRAVILVAVGAQAAQVVRAALPETPLVFGMVPDPAAAGLARVAGVAADVPVKNQLAAFRLVNPRGVRIGLLHGAETTGVIDEAQKSPRHGADPALRARRGAQQEDRGEAQARHPRRCPEGCEPRLLAAEVLEPIWT